MSKGFVIFVVKSLDYKPYFLEFGTNYNGRTTRCVSDIAYATVYPIYEAAKVVMDQLKNDADYLCIKIFDTDGNPYPTDENSSCSAADDTPYIRRSKSEDDFF